MAGKFVLKKSSSGRYHFNLVASNGQIIATSQAFERKESAVRAIAAAKEILNNADVDDQTGEPVTAG
jgi:uncharacterized protein